MIGRTALTVCILLPGVVRAQEVADLRESLTPRAWRIAPEVSRYKYREPGIMTNEGTLYGVVGSYTFHGLGDSSSAETGADGRYTLRLEGRLSFGEMEYDGSYMDDTPVSLDGIDDFLFDLRMLWGRELTASRLSDAVYAGLGYRYLNDDSSSEVGGYERKSNYVYVPLGSRKDFDMAGPWSLSVTSELDVLIVGRQISYLSDADPSLPDVRNWQWPGLGAGLMLDLRHTGTNVDLSLAPFLRCWWIAESSTSDGYYEPRNNTFEYGLAFVIRF